MKVKTDVLGIKIDNLNAEQLHSKIYTSLKSDKTIKIYTPNPEIILKARKDKALKEILNSSDILVADGTGVVLASKLLSSPLPERLPGIEIGEFLLGLADKEALSVFLLGGEAGVAIKAAQNINKKYPNLKICGTHHGYFQNSENEKLVRSIAKLNPDIIFVCMGFPRQEIWISQNAHLIPSLKIAVGLGGSLDVWSGKLRRAPVFMRRISLEWLWRIMLEPKRIKFLLQIPIFLTLVVKQKLLKQ